MNVIVMISARPLALTVVLPASQSTAKSRTFFKVTTIISQPGLPDSSLYISHPHETLLCHPMTPPLQLMTPLTPRRQILGLTRQFAA